MSVTECQISDLAWSSYSLFLWWILFLPSPAWRGRDPREAVRCWPRPAGLRHTTKLPCTVCSWWCLRTPDTIIILGRLWGRWQFSRRRWGSHRVCSLRSWCRPVDSQRCSQTSGGPADWLPTLSPRWPGLDTTKGAIKNISSKSTKILDFLVETIYISSIFGFLYHSPLSMYDNI